MEIEVMETLIPLRKEELIARNISPELQKEIECITETIKEAVDCEKIYLFGSYAYGEPHKDSDLDFYVVIPDDEDRVIKVEQRIRKFLGRLERTMPIETIAVYSSQFADLNVLPTLERKIVREGILLYEQI